MVVELSQKAAETLRERIHYRQNKRRDLRLILQHEFSDTNIYLVTYWNASAKSGTSDSFGFHSAFFTHLAAVKYLDIYYRNKHSQIHYPVIVETTCGELGSDLDKKLEQRVTCYGLSPNRKFKLKDLEAVYTCLLNRIISGGKHFE